MKLMNTYRIYSLIEINYKPRIYIYKYMQMTSFKEVQWRNFEHLINYNQ